MMNTACTMHRMNSWSPCRPGSTVHGNDGHGYEQPQGEIPNGVDAFIQGGMIFPFLGVKEQTDQDAGKHAAYVDGEGNVQGFQYGEERTADPQRRSTSGTWPGQYPLCASDCPWWIFRILLPFHLFHPGQDLPGDVSGQ